MTNLAAPLALTRCAPVLASQTAHWKRPAWCRSLAARASCANALSGKALRRGQLHCSAHTHAEEDDRQGQAALGKRSRGACLHPRSTPRSQARAACVLDALCVPSQQWLVRRPRDKPPCAWAWLPWWRRRRGPEFVRVPMALVVETARCAVEWGRCGTHTAPSLGLFVCFP